MRWRERGDEWKRSAVVGPDPDKRPAVCNTNGHAAVFTWGVAPRGREVARETGTARADVLATAWATPAMAVDRPALEAFVAPPPVVPRPPCERCKGTRSVRCGECSGTGKVERDCSHCDEAHTCVCDEGECEDGLVPCPECDEPIRVVRILGVTFDADLVHETIARMEKSDAFVMGLNERQETLVLRNAGSVGAVMKVRWMTRPCPVFP